MLYAHLQHHNGTIIIRQTQEDFFIKIFTSHFICKVTKGLLKICVWEGAVDRTQLKYFDLSLLWPSRCVFLVLLMLNRRPKGSLCWVLPSFTASYQQLLWIPTHQGPKPLRPGVALPTTSLLQLAATQLAVGLNWQLFNSSALYYLQTPARRYGHASTPPQFLPISGDRDVSLPLSLEWPVWSSSSGNNFHAVHRSLSSGASVYECTIGIFFSSSHFISQFPPTRFPLITAIGMVTSFRCITLEWHFWPGQKVKMQH